MAKIASRLCNFPMFKMRHRSPRGYQPVSTEDDLDDVPEPFMYHPHPKK